MTPWCCCVVLMRAQRQTHGSPAVVRPETLDSVVKLWKDARRKKPIESGDLLQLRYLAAHYLRGERPKYFPPDADAEIAKWLRRTMRNIMAATEDVELLKSAGLATAADFAQIASTLTDMLGWDSSTHTNTTLRARMTAELRASAAFTIGRLIFHCADAILPYLDVATIVNRFIDIASVKIAPVDDLMRAISGATSEEKFAHALNQRAVYRFLHNNRDWRSNILPFAAATARLCEVNTDFHKVLTFARCRCSCSCVCADAAAIRFRCVAKLAAKQTILRFSP